jgi:hypothetical protein
MNNNTRLIIPAMLFLFLACNKHDSFELPSFSKVYGGSDGDAGHSIVANAEGGYVLAASSSSNNGDVSGNHGMSDFWIIKVDRAGNLLWQKSLGGSRSESVSSLVPSTDGGYVIAGSSRSNDGDVTGVHGPPDGFTFLDAWVIKVDKNGNLVWQKALGGTSIEIALSIVASPDGGYVVAGYTQSNDGDVSGNHGITADAWIVKLDENGNIIWQKTVGGSDHDFANSIIATKGGGYIVSGQTSSNNGDVSGNHGSVDAWLFKLGENGNLLWQKTYGGSNNDYGRSVATGSDDGYVLLGYTNSNDGDVSGNHGRDDAWVVKVDGNGNKRWQKTIGGSNDEYVSSIVTIPHVGYAFAGISRSNDGDVSGNHGNGDAWVVAIDAGGNILGQRSMGGSGDDAANSIIITHGKNYVIGGYTSSNNGDVSGNHGAVDAWIIRGKF